MNPIESMVHYWKTKGVKMSDIERTIQRIQEKQNGATPGTEEFKRLGADLEQAIKNKKLFKEAKSFGLKPDTVLMAFVILLVALWGFSLDLDSPKALKIASFALKLPGVKI